MSDIRGGGREGEGGGGRVGGGAQWEDRVAEGCMIGDEKGQPACLIIKWRSPPGFSLTPSRLPPHLQLLWG